MKCGVILILFLLALATSASAECSWVLWFQETFYGPNLVNEASPWLLIKATPTYAYVRRRRLRGSRTPASPPRGPRSPFQERLSSRGCAMLMADH